MPRPTRRIAAVFILVGLAALAFALPAAAGGRPYTTALTGAAERPNPGDPDATGSARVTVNPGTREVCWSVEVQGVDLPLVAALNGCATVDRSLAFALLLTPEDYYVNVHTALFPAGAARGQLG